MKKLLAFLLIMALAAPVGGCSKGPKPTPEPTPAPSPTPLVVTQVSVGLPGLKPAVPGELSGDMREYFKNTFGIEFTPWQPSGEDWEAGVAEAAASKSLPDMFAQGIFGDSMLFKQLVDQRLVREIPESVYRNYHYLGTEMYRYANTESVDGKMYFVPRTDMAQTYNNGSSVAIFYRLDWALQSGQSTAGQAPSWQQFMDLMNYCAHDDPDDNGMDDSWGLTCAGPDISGLSTAFMSTFGVREWVLEDGQWVPGVLSQRMKEAVQWASQAYRSGCLDPDFATLTMDAAIEKFCSGQAGMLVADVSPAGAGRLNDVFKVKQPGVDILGAVSVLPQPVDPWGVSYNDESSYDMGILFSSSVDDTKLKNIFALMEWLYTDDGLTYANWGEAGKDFNVTGSGLQTLHKDETGLPITFGKLNSDWKAMASLATYGKDFVPAPDREMDAYKLKYLDILRDSWWPNDWRKPLFTRTIFDRSLQDFDRDRRAEAALADMIVRSKNIDEDWAAYADRMNDELNVAAVEKIVNDYAREHGVTAEE
jgi:putative aldouronate transport system substrate-binding protein